MSIVNEFGPVLFATLIGSFGLVIFSYAARYFAGYDMGGLADIILALIAFDLAIWADKDLFQIFVRNESVANIFSELGLSLMVMSAGLFLVCVFLGERRWITRETGSARDRILGLVFSWLTPVAWLGVHGSMIVK